MGVAVLLVDDGTCEVLVGKGTKGQDGWVGATGVEIKSRRALFG